MKNNLRSHQWKSFRRNPMFERNLAVRIFMIFTFSFLALEFIVLGFVLDKILLELNLHTYAIDTFNSILIFLLVVDFTIKFFMKQNRAMQIAPYLTLPIKRTKLLDFLLRKELSSFWNFFWLFLVLPFAFRAITPFYGLLSAVLYIVFFYLACLCVSLLINYINNLLSKSNWFYSIPVLLITLPFILLFGLHLPIGDYFVQFGEWIIQKNPLAWLGVLLVFATLWFLNRKLMLSLIYKEMEGEKFDRVSTFSNLSFLDNFGQMGSLIALDLKLITRAKRLKQQVYFVFFFLIFYLFMLYSGNSQLQASAFNGLFFPMITIGYPGLIMGQYLFTSESSFFDGLMSRNISLFTMLRGKYFLYSLVSLIPALVFLVPAFQGKISFLLVVSLFFFVVGFIYFLIFQNAVYNKSYFDPFDGSMMNWKGTSSSMMIITMLTMFIPLFIIMGISSIWGLDIACYCMLIVGLIFTLTCNIWLKWTYERFRNRRYKNMEGFRNS